MKSPDVPSHSSQWRVFISAPLQDTQDAGLVYTTDGTLIEVCNYDIFNANQNCKEKADIYDPNWFDIKLDWFLERIFCK